MELHGMLYARLATCETLAEMLTTFAGRPAVFYQNAPPADAPGWAERQYPRIDYTVDMQENPERNSSGALMVNVWCDTEYGPEPETIERAVRELLHATFAQDEDPYFFAWARSDTFTGANDVHTIGVTVVFDVIACPTPVTHPDPIRAIGLWSKGVLPDAVVLGIDAFEGWLVPTRERPVVYWRLSGQSVAKKTFTASWLRVIIEGHVYAKSAADRLHSLVKIETAAALVNHVEMEDGSPLFLPTFKLSPQADYVTAGQIHAEGSYGIHQPDGAVSSNATGDTLRNITFSTDLSERRYHGKDGS